MNRLLVGLSFIAAVGASIATSTASAASLECTGKVQSVGYHQPGQVMLRLVGMNVPVYVCSLAVNWAPPGSMGAAAPPDSCKGILSAMMAAKASDASVYVIFDGNAVPASCGAFTPQAEVNLRHWLY